MLYFAYGSNLHLTQMMRRCPNAVPMHRAKLRGWSLRFSVHADIEPTPNGVVHGAVYFCDARDVAALDRYEGVALGYYYKHTVTVELETGQEVQALVYVMEPAGRSLNLIPPTDSYYETVATGYKNWNIPLRGLRRAARAAERAQEEVESCR